LSFFTFLVGNWLTLPICGYIFIDEKVIDEKVKWI